jgi:hypothetical protein
MKVDEHTLVDEDELIEWTGETPESLAIFVYEGILQRDEQARYPLLKSCKAIIKYWQAVIVWRERSREPQG